MSLESKIKKLKKSNKKAQGKLIKLVANGAKKKKILDQVDEIQSLDKQERKLTKKAKTTVKHKASRSSIKAKEEKHKKIKEEKNKKAKKAPNKKAKKTAAVKVKSKPSKKDRSIAKGGAKKMKVTKGPNVDKSNQNGRPAGILSTSFTAREALGKFAQLQTLEAIENFIKGEQRKTVLDKADSRRSALLKKLSVPE